MPRNGQTDSERETQNRTARYAEHRGQREPQQIGEQTHGNRVRSSLPDRNKGWRTYPLFLFSSAATARHRKVSLPGCHRKQDAAFHTHTIRNASSEAVHTQGEPLCCFRISSTVSPRYTNGTTSLARASRRREENAKTLGTIRPTPFESRNAFSLPPFRFPLFTSRKRAMHGNGIFIVSLPDDRNRRNDD